MKTILGIGYGQSNKTVEKSLSVIAREIKHSLTPAEYELIVQGKLSSIERISPAYVLDLFKRSEPTHALAVDTAAGSSSAAAVDTDAKSALAVDTAAGSSSAAAVDTDAESALAVDTAAGSSSAAVPSKPLKAMHVNSRAFDTWLSHPDVKEAMVALASTSKTKEESIVSATRKIAWLRWQLKSDVEKADFAAEFMLHRGNRPRNQAGKFTNVAEVDKHSLASLVPPELKARRYLNHKELAAVGTAALSMAKGMVAADGKETMSIKQLMTKSAVAAKLSLKKRTKAIADVTSQRHGKHVPRGKMHGRPKGSLKMNDETLKGILQNHSIESCVIHRPTRTPLRSLTSSMATIHRTDVDVKKKISYRTLCRRMRRRRLGTAKGSRRIDCCDVCESFDQHAGPQLEKGIAGIMETLEEHLPTYFESFLPDALSEGARRRESPIWLQQLIAYIASHEERNEAVRAELPFDVQFMLHEQEKQAMQTITAPDGLMDEIKIWSWHFSLRDRLRAVYGKHRRSPAARTIYICVDHKE